MRILGILVAMTLTGGAGAALAQDDGLQCREAGPGQIVCDDWDIEGRPQTPRAFVLINRARERYEAPPLERDMTREIRRTVQRSPF